MPNYYCSSSFSLPSAWPSEAKELFSCLVNGFRVSKSAKDVENLFKSNGIPTEDYDFIYLYDSFLSLYDNCSVPEAHGDQGVYSFYSLESFDPDTVQTLLDIVTEQFKIPYDQRIEVQYCWSCDRPEDDAFGGSTIVSYWEPLKKEPIVVPLTNNKKHILKAIDTAHTNYIKQINALDMDEAKKEGLHSICDCLFYANSIWANSLGKGSDARKILVPDDVIYNTLKTVRCRLEYPNA